MKRGYYILMFSWLLLGWSGCGLLKQTAKTTASSRQDSTIKTQFKAKDAQEAVKQTLSLTLNRDAAAATYSMLLWPKGRFTFSTEKGFEGEADSVQMTGESWAFEDHSEIVSTGDQQKTESEVEGKQELKVKSVQEDSAIESFANYKLIIGAVAFIFLLLFLVFRIRSG